MLVLSLCVDRSCSILNPILFLLSPASLAAAALVSLLSVLLSSRHTYVDFIFLCVAPDDKHDDTTRCRCRRQTADDDVGDNLAQLAISRRSSSEYVHRRWWWYCSWWIVVLVVMMRMVERETPPPDKGPRIFTNPKPGTEGMKE